MVSITIYTLIVGVVIGAAFFATYAALISSLVSISIGLIAALLWLYALGALAIVLPGEWKAYSRAHDRSKPQALTFQMEQAYGALVSFGPISARHIDRLLLDLEREGAKWPPPIFTLLDDIISRGGRF